MDAGADCEEGADLRSVSLRGKVLAPSLGDVIATRFSCAFQCIMRLDHHNFTVQGRL